MSTPVRNAGCCRPAAGAGAAGAAACGAVGVAAGGATGAACALTVWLKPDTTSVRVRLASDARYGTARPTATTSATRFTSGSGLAASRCAPHGHTAAARGDLGLLRRNQRLRAAVNDLVLRRQL